ncbi:MAG: hypothetical protein HZB26_12880 [Candidatus Hydrogenedentes bacterium]|nr:hypothetical protein [Candidatus Hydrogenedentota bacterium]
MRHRHIGLAFPRECTDDEWQQLPHLPAANIDGRQHFSMRRLNGVSGALTYTSEGGADLGSPDEYVTCAYLLPYSPVENELASYRIDGTRSARRNHGEG